MDIRVLLCLLFVVEWIPTKAFLEHEVKFVGTFTDGNTTLKRFFPPHGNLMHQVISMKLEVTDSPETQMDMPVNVVVLDEQWNRLGSVNATFHSGPKFDTVCPFFVDDVDIEDTDYQAVITGPAGVTFELFVRFIFAEVPITDRHRKCDPEMMCLPQLDNCRADSACSSSLDECGKLPADESASKNETWNDCWEKNNGTVDDSSQRMYKTCANFCKLKPGTYNQHASDQHLYITFIDVTEEDVEDNTIEVRIESRDKEKFAKENKGKLLVGNSAAGCPSIDDLYRDSANANRLTFSHTGTLHFAAASTPKLEAGRWYIGVLTSKKADYDLTVSRGEYADMGTHYVGSIVFPFFICLLFLVSTYAIHREKNTHKHNLWKEKMYHLLRDWFSEGHNGVPISYAWYTFIVATSFGISSIQVVFSTYTLMQKSGNHDICFYNDKCFHPSRVWHVPINNIESNAGYMIMGVAFILQTAIYQYHYCHSVLCDWNPGELVHHMQQIALELDDLSYLRGERVLHLFFTNPLEPHKRILRNLLRNLEFENHPPGDIPKILKNCALVLQKNAEHILHRNGELVLENNREIDGAKMRRHHRRNDPYIVDEDDREIICAFVETFHAEYPSQFGYSTFYALGWALTAEGCYSLFYHICPKIEIFQFDTANMFLIAFLLMIATYQQGEKDRNMRGPPDGDDEYNFSFIRAPKFFVFVIIPLFAMNYVGVEIDTEEKYSRGVFAVFVVLWEIWLFTYFYFQSRNNNRLEYEARDHKGCLKYITPPSHICKGAASGVCGGWIAYLCLVLLIVILTFWVILSRRTDIATLFLALCIMLSILFLGRMGCCHIIPDKSFYILITLLMTAAVVLFGIAAMYFLAETTDKAKPADVSRLLNGDCVAGSGWGYFDYHDLWHIIGSYGLYLFMQAVFWINPPQRDIEARIIRRQLVQASATPDEPAVSIRKSKVRARASVPKREQTEADEKTDIEMIGANKEGSDYDSEDLMCGDVAVFDNHV